MKIFAAISILLLLLGCKKVDTDSIENLAGGKVEILGHGGSGFQTPTNPTQHDSERSVVRAIDQLHADGVEIDIQMSKDSVLFLFHDEELDNETQCSGCIGSTESEMLMDCKFSNGLGAELGEADPVALAETILQLYAEREQPPTIFFDTRIVNYCEPDLSIDEGAMARALHSLIEKYDAYQWVIIENSSYQFLAKLASLDSRFKLTYQVQSLPDHLDEALNLGATGFTIRKEFVTREDVIEAHQLGLSVYIYNVRSAAAHREALDKWPDGIQTDNIELLQSMLLD